MSRVASFHVARFPARRTISRLVSLPAERWEAEQAPGCIFAKALGTSAGGTTRTSMDIRRWALFVVWESSAQRRAFFDESAVLRKWTTTANDITHHFLDPLSSRGAWNGVELFPNLDPSVSDEHSDDQPIAVLTRAAVRVSKLVRFTRAAPSVDRALQAASGCRLAMGIGELPVGQQATFSVWENAVAMQAFARSRQHDEVVARRYKERWYSEELFTRFAVVSP